MIKKLIELIKKKLFPKIKDFPQVRKSNNFFLDNLLIETEYKALMSSYFKTNQDIAEENYIMFYVYDVFVKAAINILIGYLLSYEFEYNNSKTEIKKEIDELLKKIKIKKLLEDMLLRLSLFGYFCYYIDILNRDINKLIPLNAKILRKISDDYIEFRDGKKYRKDNFLVYKNNDITDLGVSPLLSLIPYINNNLILLDAMKFTTARFLSPAILVGYKNNVSQIIRDDWEQQFKNLASVGKIPLIFYNQEELSLDFFKPTNIYGEYVKLIENYISIIFMAFGIQAGLTTSSSGSYAKAKIQENMIEFYTLKLLKIFLEEIKNKVIDTYIAFNFEEDFVNNNTGEFRIINEPSEE